MDTLHILRSSPDAGTEKMISELSHDSDAMVIELFGPDVEWGHVVDAIFAHNRVICWW